MWISLNREGRRIKIFSLFMMVPTDDDADIQLGGPSSQDL